MILFVYRDDDMQSLASILSYQQPDIADLDDFDDEDEEFDRELTSAKISELASQYKLMENDEEDPFCLPEEAFDDGELWNLFFYSVRLTFERYNTVFFLP